MTKTCQSCGMPLYSSEMLGTDGSGIPVEEYCKYCYTSGEFTQQVTMDEMIALCAEFVDASIRPAAVVNMRIHFPTLKRWAKREKTQHEYHKSVRRVIEYIKQHIDEPLKIDTFVEVAALSPFHFHRIFKSTIGETPSNYLKRQRMEWVALQLQTTLTPLSDLALRIGYSSEQALSRAFKKHFELPPSAFREYYWNTRFAPRICRMSAKTVVMLSDEIDWNKLYLFAIICKLINKKTEHIELIPPDKAIPCLTVKERIKTSPKLAFATIPEGLYVIFVCHEDPHEFYRTIIPQWLISTKYKHAPHSAYIKYISTQEQQSVAEVYVPIK